MSHQGSKHLSWAALAVLSLHGVAGQIDSSKPVAIADAVAGTDYDYDYAVDAPSNYGPYAYEDGYGLVDRFDVGGLSTSFDNIDELFAELFGDLQDLADGGFTGDGTSFGAIELGNLGDLGGLGDNIQSIIGQLLGELNNLNITDIISNVNAQVQPVVDAARACASSQLGDRPRPASRAWWRVCATGTMIWISTRMTWMARMAEYSPAGATCATSQAPVASSDRICLWTRRRSAPRRAPASCRT